MNYPPPPPPPPPPPMIAPLEPPPGPAPALAITSFIFGILAIVLLIVCVGAVFAIPAVICGHLAHKQITGSGGQLGGKSLAVAGFTMGYVSIGLTLIILPIAIPGFGKVREISYGIRCVNHLQRIDAAKQQWAEEHEDTTEEPTREALLPYLDGKFPRCPAGGVYSINAITERPTCSLGTNVLHRVLRTQVK